MALNALLGKWPIAGPPWHRTLIMLTNGGLTQVACFLASTTKENRTRFHEVCDFAPLVRPLCTNAPFPGRWRRWHASSTNPLRWSSNSSNCTARGGGGMICRVMPGLVVESCSLVFFAREHTDTHAHRFKYRHGTVRMCTCARLHSCIYRAVTRRRYAYFSTAGEDTRIFGFGATAPVEVDAVPLRSYFILTLDTLQRPKVTYRLPASQVGGISVGACVLHPDRGPGVVVRIDVADERGKPVTIEYENGEVHHYSLASSHKLRVLARAALAREITEAPLPRAKRQKPPAPLLLPTNLEQMSVVVDPKGCATANSVVPSVGFTKAAFVATIDAKPTSLTLAPPVLTTCELPAFSEADGGTDAQHYVPPYEERLLCTSGAGGLSQIIFGPP